MNTGTPQSVWKRTNDLRKLKHIDDLITAIDFAVAIAINHKDLLQLLRGWARDHDTTLDDADWRRADSDWQRYRGHSDPITKGMPPRPLEPQRTPPNA